MTEKENTPTKSSEENKEQKSSTQGNKQSNKQTKKPFWKKHFLSLLLLLGIVIAVVWGLIGQNRLQKEHKNEIEQLVSDHNQTMNKFVMENSKLITSTLALAVRSELIDENKDQVDQYFLQTIKNNKISKIMLVNHKNGKIDISTNRKDEGTIFENQKLVNTKDVISENKTDVIVTATPVMGLNSQMAVLVVEIAK